MIPTKTVERFCTYRKILLRWRSGGKERFYSHELADEANITSAQVRRDLMSLETIGTPAKGYITENIIEELGIIMEGESGQNVILVGVGKLGSAILSYFVERRPDLKIVAAFDRDDKKIGHSFSSCPCLPLSELATTVKENQVMVAILTVPEEAAQRTANMLVEVGIMAIVNFTPENLRVPDDVHIENLDFSTSLEKSSYYARVYAQKRRSCDEATKLAQNDDSDSRKKILCIDDDKDVVDSYLAILRRSGYLVDSAFDGESGLAKAREIRPDLIILDVMMKNATEGFHVAYELRQDENLKYVPILMLTAVAGESGFKFSKKNDGAFLPVDAFVEKPVAPNSLVAVVKKLLTLPPEEINVEGRAH